LRSYNHAVLLLKLNSLIFRILRIDSPYNYYTLFQNDTFKHHIKHFMLLSCKEFIVQCRIVDNAWRKNVSVLQEKRLLSCDRKKAAISFVRFCRTTNFSSLLIGYSIEIPLSPPIPTSKNLFILHTLVV